MIRVLPGLLVLALTIYAVIDCIQTDDRVMRGLPKALWVLLILVFPVVGAVAWFIAGRPRRPRPQGGRTQSPPPPRGPDDDPDFLRRL